MAVVKRVRSGEAAALPICDLEAEASVVGAMLLDPQVVSRLIGQLEPEDFYRENHGAIFRAGLELFSQGRPIDHVTLAAGLERAGVLEQVGGRAQLAMLQEQTPTAANVEHYAGIVKDRSRRRQLRQSGATLGELAGDLGLETDEVLSQAGDAVFQLAQEGPHRSRHLSELVGEALARLELRRADGSGLTGVPSGLHDLDRLTGGWQASDLIVFAARPSMGKSALALEVLLAAARRGTRGVLFSLEMDEGAIVDRLLAMVARVPLDRLRRGLTSEAEDQRIAAAANEVSDLPIVIDARPALDELSVMAEARRLQMAEGIGLVIVDYLQLMHSRGQGHELDRVQEVSRITRAMKAMARELEVPVVALSQLSRACEQRSDKRPLLSDLRESGEIEQTADLVLFPFRPEYYD
ncbi:MAG: replicative DNA helicase, partial [Candidatus Dormibacteraeota bacterium]|nr:replicative DNA helicase [Candidatus Dormibacteraeota bacterium]